MFRKACLLPFFLLLALVPSGRTGHPAPLIPTAYSRADKFFNHPNPTDATDSMALAGFNQVISLLSMNRNRQNDSLLYQSYLKKGILLDVRNENLQAKQAYLRAANLVAPTGYFSDSLLFKPFIYAGSDFYTLNNFDSANYYLIKSEELARRYPGTPEKERLYNTLGALHFANGNYQLSRNYFSEALERVRQHNPYDSVFAQGLQANIASSYYKMGRYPEALEIYKKIRSGNSAPYIYNGICMNMGKAYQALKQYPEAMAAYRKIQPDQSPGVWNELALAYFEQGNSDSATYCLNQLQASDKTDINLLDLGINQLYRSDLLVQKEEFLPALNCLQEAIVYFSGKFENKDIYTNPAAFTGSYTYFRLFFALQKKAQAFAGFYHSSPSEKYLLASMDAYRAALRLLQFVEKSYDTDDAKFFLKQNSSGIYSEALEVSLQLNDLFPQGGFLETAFQISEQNKASVLAAKLKQRSLATLPGVDSTYLQTERNLHYNIARLDIESQQINDNSQLEKIAQEKAGYEIELSQLHKSLEQDNRYFQLKYDDAFHGSAELQAQLASGQALFNFYQTPDALLVFAITKNDFRYAKITGLQALESELQTWLRLLQSGGDGRKFDPSAGQSIYEKIILPMQSLAPGHKEWIIIPDGLLNALPFESLPADAKGNYLVESILVSYQFSSRFFLHPALADQQSAPYRVLSMAPFIKAIGGRDALTGSLSETDGLPGAHLEAKDATKKAFLDSLGSYPILHLATHAIAEPDRPNASYIAFYPAQQTAADNLFLEEIYGLNLSDCKLAIISACETGTGEWVKNEGLISLGRAFAYAGCGATIHSLWKADDRATAAILKSFHGYLQKGMTKSKALQQAKIDYLHSDALYKSPAFWSHLVLMGSTTPVTAKTSSVPGMMLPVGLLMLLIFVLLLGRRKKVDVNFLK